MEELLQTDWGRYIAGGGVIAGLFFVLRMLLASTNFAFATYRSAGKFDAARLHDLEEKVDSLTAKITGLEADYREQRQLKHDWKSFAASLMQERWTILRFAQLHHCDEIVQLMEQLDDLRRDNPLMTDVQSMIRGDVEHE